MDINFDAIQTACSFTRRGNRYRISITFVCGWLLVGCMASNCPIKSCHVRMEHLHGGRVYRGTFLGTMHKPSWWLVNRRGEGARASLATDKKDSDSEQMKQVKTKKQFHWEKE